MARSRLAPVALAVLLAAAIDALPTAPIPTANAQPADVAAQVVTLRREVDDLAQRLADRRRTLRDELAALRAERAELQRQLRLERVRAKTLAELEQQRVERREDTEEQSRAWLEPARAAVAAARAYVSTSLPFKSAERLAVLDRIAADLAGSQPDAGRAMARLWRFIEEEQAMAKEVALAQQPIELDGQRRLVDVARVGMAVMYARSPDGTYAWAVAGDDGWSFAALQDPASVELVRSLFDALDANQRFGPRRLLIPSGLGNRPAGAAK